MHPSPSNPLPLAMALDPSPSPSPSRRPLSALDSNTSLPPFHSSITKPHLLRSSAANHGHDYSGERGDCRGTKRKSPRRSGQETDAAQLFLSISPSIGSDTTSGTRLDHLSSTDAATDANKIAKIENHSDSPHRSLLKVEGPTIRETCCNEPGSEMPSARFDSKCDDKKPSEIAMVRTVSTIVCSSKRPPAYPKRDKSAAQPPRLRLASAHTPRHVSETTSLNSSNESLSVIAPVRAFPCRTNAESSISNVSHRELSMLSSDNPIWISNSTVGDRGARDNNGYGLIKSEQQFCEMNGMHREANCGQIGKEWHKGGRNKAPNHKKLPSNLHLQHQQKQQQTKDQKRKMSQLSVLTDLLGQVRPGIIRKLRCRGQVHAAIAAMIGISDKSCSGRRCAPTPSSASSHIEKSQEESSLALVKLAHLNKHRNRVHKSRASASDQEAGDSATESLETAEVRRMGYHPRHTEHCLARPRESGKDDGLDVSENLIPCWLELLRLDLKGRLSALKRSRKRVRGVILSAEFDMGRSMSFSRCSSIDGGTEANLELQKWKDFFLHMDDALCSEGDKLEKWLGQVVEMQNHCHQNKGSAPPPWEMTSCLPSAICRMNAEALGSNLGLQHSAAKTTRCPAS